MNILILSDIHSNYRALKAVLDVFGDADEIWCLGDIVEYGPCPSECIQLVREACTCVLLGNHDHSLAEFDPETGNPNSWAAYDYPNVSDEERGYLADLPSSLTKKVNGKTFLLVHGSPQDPVSSGLKPATAIETLEEAASMTHEDVILCAHTHMAMKLEINGTTILNTGTIGQPRDGDHRAQCWLLQDGEFHFRRVDYDLNELESDYRRSGIPLNIQDDWIRYTCSGIVDVHGLQIGPYTGRG
jgi:putative phosphoesterase